MSKDPYIPHVFVPKKTNNYKKQEVSDTIRKFDCELGDIIMVSDCHCHWINKCFHTRFGDVVSPVFKVKHVRYNKLELEIMKVVFPYPVYRCGDELEEILEAIKDGNAVVDSTTVLFSLRRSEIFKIKKLEIQEIQVIEALQSEANKTLCLPMESTMGSVKCNNPNKGVLKFFITKSPIYGNCFIEDDGRWEYTNTAGTVITDAFEVTIWDSRGAYTIQKVILQVKEHATNFYEYTEKINQEIPEIAYGKIFNIAHVSELGGFVQNRGTKAIEVILQCSPNGQTFIDEGYMKQILPGQMIFMTPVYYTPYIRLKVYNDPDETINVQVWYYGHMDY
ncbi:MAG: DUF6385 domain-containing protein [Turicibacter sp.]